MRRARRIRIVGHLVTAALAVAAIAHAEPRPSVAREATKRFQRGVSLYMESDYRAALVEFKRAYETAPNPAVLYNIGQTHYQLQNYAAALAILERYLAESGPNASHRSEVEQTIETLRGRVGKLELTTNVPDCEVSIDDETIGKTPLAQAPLVSLGRRKVTATRDGYMPETKFVEVGAGDTVKVAITLVERGLRPGAVAARATPEARATGAPEREAKQPPSRASMTVGWVTTGVLAVGTITLGALAFGASRSLKDARASYPVTHDDLTAKGSRVTTLSTVADVLGASTIVAAGVSVYLTLAPSASPDVKVGVGHRGVSVQGSF